MLAALDHTYRLEGNAGFKRSKTVEYHCTASIGVTLFGAHMGNVDELLKQADLAMYQAKESGRNAILGIPEHRDRRFRTNVTGHSGAS